MPGAVLIEIFHLILTEVSEAGINYYREFTRDTETRAFPKVVRLVNIGV